MMVYVVEWWDTHSSGSLGVYTSVERAWARILSSVKEYDEQLVDRRQLSAVTDSGVNYFIQPHEIDR